MYGSLLGTVMVLPGPAVGGDAVDEGGGTLVVVFGQSNAETHDLAANLTAPHSFYASAYRNVRQMAQQDTTFGDNPMVWQTATPAPLGSISYNLGGGAAQCVGFAPALLQDLDLAAPHRPFAVAVIAVGGSSLKTEWNPAGTYPSLPGGTPNLYHQAVAYIKSAMSALGCSSVVLCWEQGEADAKTIADGTAYQASLEAFIDQIRADLGNIGPGGTEVPFVFGELNAQATAATYLGLAQLRTSQVNTAAARTHTTLVSQDSITTASGLYDGTHYNAEGYVSVGHLYSPAVAAYCGVRIQPVASFTTSVAGLAVTFTDTSVSYGSSVTGWFWQFGDGATSTAQNPSHTYAAGGTYNVVLTVTNAAGDHDASPAVAVSVISGFTGVTRDPLSAWYVPSSGTEWTTFHTDITSTVATPDSYHLFQEASGNPADTGVAAITLTAVNTPAYQQAVTNWSRKAITFADGTAKGLNSTAAGLPDISTTSMLWAGYVLFPAAPPTVDRAIISLGTSAATRVGVIIQATTGKIYVESTTTNKAFSTTNMCDGKVHFVAIQVNRTGTAVVCFTELEKLSPTFGATMTGKGYYIGEEPSGLATYGGGVLYDFALFGVNAEITSTQMKNEVQNLTGLTVPWS